jgi:hypothetical protein
MTPPGSPAARPVAVAGLPAVVRCAKVGAVLLAAGAAWLSQGTLAMAATGTPRLGVLPASIPALLVVLTAVILVAGLWRAGAPLAPLSLLLLIVYPWLPLPAPAAALAWSGPIRWLVWFTVALLLVQFLGPAARRVAGASVVGRWFRDAPRRAAFVCAFVVFTASAWQVAPSIPGGDEPHYLVITQSLLLDRDLKIENNHRRGDYHAYVAGTLPPHYLRRGRDNEIYSIHAPGLPAIVAPAFAIAGYRGVVLFLIAMAACGSALAWHLAWLATGRAAPAWFGWAVVTWSATAIFHSFTVYPDGPGGVVVLTGLWALFRAHQERVSGSAGSARLLPWILHGAALATLPWLHSRFAVLACSLGALVLLRLPGVKRPAEKAVAFLLVPTLSAIAWIAFFVIIYGRADPSAPYGSSRDFSVGFIPGGLTGLLLDQRFGLVANAPALLCGFAGLVWMLRRVDRSREDGAGMAGPRLSLELLFVFVPYLLTATSYAMWWAGWSAPARFANPAVFALAIPAAVFWQRATTSGHRATIAIGAGSLALTAFLSFVLVTVDGGRLAYNTRQATALWLDWASPIAALGAALPAWYRGEELTFARDAAIWIALMSAGYLFIRSIADWPALRERARYATAAVAVFAAAAMLAATIVWDLHGVHGTVAAPAQLALLRRLAVEPRVVALQIDPPRLLEPRALAAKMFIDVDAPAAGSGARLGRGDQPLVTLPWLPAGRYRVRPRTRVAGGWMMLGIAPDQFSIWTGPIPAGGAVDLDVPVDVVALVVRADEEGRRAIASVAIEPVTLVPGAARLTDRIARRAVKYDAATVFFLDETCFPEPDAFWVVGAGSGTFVLQPQRPGASVRLRLRNAPVENTITLSSGHWRETVTLAAGEERHLDVPIAAGRSAALVTASTTAGFRPSEHDPTSRDGRFLGVWVRVGGE